MKQNIIKVKYNVQSFLEKCRIDNSKAKNVIALTGTALIIHTLNPKNNDPIPFELSTFKQSITPLYLAFLKSSPYSLLLTTSKGNPETQNKTPATPPPKSSAERGQSLIV